MVRFAALACAILLIPSAQVGAEYHARTYLVRADLVPQNDVEGLKVRGKSGSRQPFKNTRVDRRGNSKYALWEVTLENPSDAQYAEELVADGKARLVREREVICDEKNICRDVVTIFEDFPSDLDRDFSVQNSTP